MTSDFVLQVKNLNKCYHIFNHPIDRLKQAFHRKRAFYREFWALRDINFEVKKGEAIGIIGRNGSGKSTLLQLICKTLTPTSGNVVTHGRIAALLELGAGFNPQFTGRENIYISGAILGYSRKEMDERFEEVIEFAEIGDFIDQPVKSYSSGMFVRLAFAVQVCINPDILIIDEALAVGDVFFRQKCYQLLSKFQQKGVSIILVTHSMNEVEQFCQKALLLRKGKQVFFGDASEAVKRYYIEEQAAFSISSKKTTATTNNQEESTDEDFFWPAASAFLDISTVAQVSTGDATCTRIAICDNRGEPTQSFQQGEAVSFFYEFKLHIDIDIPLVGLIIQNEKGIIVHGKGSLEYGTAVPNRIAKGEFLRIRQDIQLELAMGDYTFELGLGAMNDEDYNQRMHYRYEEVNAKVKRLCHLTKINHFSILPLTNGPSVQLLHHGIANLPGQCQVQRIKPKELEKN